MIEQSYKLIDPLMYALLISISPFHVFHQVNLWPAWVGFETAIFWQCSPGTVVKRNERRNNTKTAEMRTKSPQ